MIFRVITIRLRKQKENVSSSNFAISKPKNSTATISKFSSTDFVTMLIGLLKFSQKLNYWRNYQLFSRQKKRKKLN